MAVRHLRILVVAALSGSLLTLTACGQDQATPKPEAAVMGPAVIQAEPTAPPQSPRAGAPTTGACYRLSAADLAASTNASAPVSCTDQHNAMTMKVGLFPTTMTVTEPEYAQRSCARRLPSTTGLSRSAVEGTIFTAHWFGPTSEQRAAGARWFRCDVIAKTTDGTKRLPTTSAPLTNGEAPDAYARCVQLRGGSESNPVYLTCDRPHRYRWAGAFEAAGGAYPGAESLRTMVEQRCRRFVGTGPFWYTYPLKAVWRAGERTISCFRGVS